MFSRWLRTVLLLSALGAAAIAAAYFWPRARADLGALTARLPASTSSAFFARDLDRALEVLGPVSREGRLKMPAKQWLEEARAEASKGLGFEPTDPLAWSK